MGGGVFVQSIGQGDPFSVFGVHTGRPPKLTPHQRAEPIVRRNAGHLIMFALGLLALAAEEAMWV